MTASVLGVGLVTPVGLTAAATSAAMRAGIARIRHHAFDPLNEPATPFGWLDDTHLPALRTACPLDERSARLVRLSAPALAEALADATGPTPLLLALPDRRSSTDPDDRAVLDAIAVQADRTLDLSASRIFRCGRAGGLLALAEALVSLTRNPRRHVCVGGVDTHLDTLTLASLAANGRLHGESTRDGFIPGEAAAFVVLGPPRARAVRIVAVAQAQATALREGIALAVRTLLDATALPPIRRVYAGANGESQWAREWTVAQLRCGEHIAADVRVDHPVEFIGDPGAALGPLLVGLAALALDRGHARAPCLVWCGSERGERAAALIDRPEGVR